MYHPKIVSKRLDRIADAIRASSDPGFKFVEHSTAEVDEWNAKLDSIFDPNSGNFTRQPTVEEESWIRHEISRCKVDFLYFATRYASIKDKKMDLVRLNPTAVQQILLDRIAKAELDALNGKTGDGILLMVLKARQLGVSTFSDIAILHRTNFYANTTALIASDADFRTPNLYEMVIRCYDNLPWWMKAKSSDPKSDGRIKNKYLSFHDQDSVIRFGSSANMQGGSSGETKGSMGTGFTLPLVHLTEVALWNNPGQISDALLPSVPYSPRTFAIQESTAKGIDNRWFDDWQSAVRGMGRFKPVFIPWYTDPETYKLPAPSNWEPNEKSVAHAARVKLTSSQWVGKTTDLTRDQLFWWEKTRMEYEARRELYKFLAEYASEPDEAFQSTMGGPFPAELIDHMRQKAKLPIYIEVGSGRLGGGMYKTN